MPASASGPDDSVLPELVRLMFTSLKAVLTIGFAMAAVAAFLWFTGDDGIPAAFLTSAILTLAIRIAVSLGYRRADQSLALDTVAAAKRWERRYAAAGSLFALSLGLFGAYAILALDTVSLSLVLIVVLAYPCGMVVRVAVRPWIARLLLIAVFLPPIAALLIQNSPETLLAAALMAAYLASTFEMVGYLHTTIGARIRLANELSRLAMHDDLTGLPNRRYLRITLDEATDRFESGGPLFAFHAIDLDHFKRVNDSFGHAAGDELLRQVAKRLTGLVRSTDFVARLGGDEFAVVQSPVLSRGETEALADRIVTELARPFAVGGQETRIGASIGVSGPTNGAQERGSIEERADAALYSSKDKGRSGFAIATDDALVRA